MGLFRHRVAIGDDLGDAPAKVAQVKNTTPDGTEYALLVRILGGGSGGTSSTFGSAFPSLGTAAGAKDPTNNMAPVNVDASGNLKVNVVAGGAGGGAVTVADGADVAEGATTDAAVVTDVAGTVSAKLRGLVKIFADVWDSVNHQLKVVIQNATLAVTQSGSWTVTATQATAANLKVDLSGTAANATALKTQESAATPVLANTLSTTVVTVIGSAAVLASYYIYNPNSSVVYVQIFDVSGTVTLGTTVPKWSIGIPATSAANLAGLNLNFANAIKVAATTTATGSTAPATALDANFGYK